MCLRDASKDINVFTDGSWTFPLKKFLGIGGSGVWWPGRSIVRADDTSQLRHIPLSEAEDVMALARQEVGGVSISTKIGGYSGS